MAIGTVTLGLVISIALFLMPIVPTPSDVLQSVLPILTVGGLVLLLHLKMRLWAMSPIAITVGALIGTAVLGPLEATGQIAGGVSAIIVLNSDEIYRTFIIFLAAAASVCAGGLIFASFQRRAVPTIRGKIRIQAANRRTVVGGWLVLVPLLLVVIAYGPSDLLFRPTRFVLEAGNPIGIAGTVLCLPAVATLGWFSKSARSALMRFLSWLPTLMYSAVLFSLGSRAFALVPILIALGRLAADPSSRRARWMVPLSAAVALVLLPTPLALRGTYEHGLFPYLQTLLDGREPSTSVLTAVGNILFSFSLTGAVAIRVHALDLSTLVLSLDPRPGSTTDWYALVSTFRINDATPYNAIGELANHGWLYLIGFFAIVGVLLAYFDRRITSLLGQGQPAAALILFALSCYFVLQALQYNLRATTRVIYYLVLLDIGIRLAHRTLSGARTDCELEPALAAERPVPSEV